MAETFKRPMNKEVAVEGEDYTMESGKVVIASITSCTNTSNPYVMIGAGLVARKAAALGLTASRGSRPRSRRGQVVSAYLEAAGLQEDLDKIGFNLVGYGCTTCIGNSGPLQKEISEAINRGRPRGDLGPVGQPQLRGPDLARTCAPTTSPRRRWWWPMRWRARWTSTSPPTRSRRRRTGRTSTSRTSGRPQAEIAELVERPSPARRSSRNTPTSSRATRSGRASR
jgi:hypothetical protein